MTCADLRLFAPSLAPPVTVCVLLYGDHFFLCQRFFAQLFRHTPADAFHLRIGLNAVGTRTVNFVEEVARRHPHTRVYASEINIFKGPMSRRMFHEDPIETEWTIWFDDDSYVTRPDWLLNLGMAVETSPQIDLWGTHFFMWASEPLLEFIRQRPWYRGLPFQTDHGQTKIDFIAGGYWPIRTRWLVDLDWPDPRIIHFSDDYLLGEAMRQNRGRLWGNTSGVVVNAARRRSPPDTPQTY
jgi:hypothetical protein